jgi:hypothetical protein
MMGAFIATLFGRIRWSTVVSVGAAVAAIVFGLFQRQKAGTAQAEAKAAAADAAKQVAQKDAEVAQGNAAASKAATEAVKAAHSAMQETSSIPDEDLDKVGREMGIMREGK